MSNVELLGEIVTWDMETTEVAVADVRNALAAADLVAVDVAPDLKARSAFGRACKELKENRTIDKVETVKGITTFQFTDKVCSDGKIRFDDEDAPVVSLNTETGDIYCSDDEALADKARELFRHAEGVRTASDVTRMVQKLFMAHADLYAINPKKGVAYFVPEAHRSFSEKVDVFLTTMGGKLLRFPVPKGTTEGNQSVCTAVNVGLQTAIDELDAAVEAWDATTRVSTMEKAQARLDAARAKVECYGEYLGSKQERLLAAVEVSKEKMIAKIFEVGTLELNAARSEAK